MSRTGGAWRRGADCAKRVAGAQGASQGRAVLDEPLKAEDFEPHVGETFRSAEPTHDLVLERVDVHAGDVPAHLPRRPFSLVFRGPKPGPVLREGVHAFETEDGGRLEFYIAPIHTPQSDRQDYQSVFN